MSIHTVGDSHSINGWSGIINHNLGSKLCYSFGRDKLDGLDICKCNIKYGDSIIFCLGEIDCRCQVHKYINETTTYEDIINNIVDNYFEAIKLMVNALQLKLENVCVYNVVPPGQKHNTYEQKAAP